MRRCALLLLGVLAVAPAAAAAPVTGQRETVELSFTTRTAGAASGFLYRASFRKPGDPAADPPALRRLVIEAPAGSSLDTSVPGRCTATDEELKQRGEAACPSASRIGSGTADIKPMLFPTISYTSAFFNDANEQVELFTADPPAPPVVVHGFIRGNILDSPIPTCLNGGFAPRDCPSDQVALKGNVVDIPAYTRGGRSYFTTPPRCPASGEWRSPISFHYGDGSVERLVTEQPCEPARLALGRPRIAPGGRLVRLPVRVLGTAARLRVRAAVKRVGSGRILGRAPRETAVRGTRRVGVRLRRRLRAGRHAAVARAPGAAPRAVRRFTVPAPR